MKKWTFWWKVLANIIKKSLKLQVKENFHNRKIHFAQLHTFPWVTQNTSTFIASSFPPFCNLNKLTLKAMHEFSENE